MSRKPPLPRGPPPRLDNRYRPEPRHADSYRPYDDRETFHRERDSHYRPRSPPPPVYEFRGDSRYDSRPSYDAPRYPPRYEGPAPGTSNEHHRTDTWRPNEPPHNPEMFTFRQAPPPSMDLRAADNYRRSPPRQRARQDNNQKRSFGGAQSQRGRGGYRGRGGPRLPADREFLKGNRSPTPELMEGMDEEAGTVKYKPIEDLSDSDEADMDVSDDDNPDAGQPKKKQARTESKAADGDSAPKWSNPDPYTALPPPDESLRKKKDMVKLIRKARVTAVSDGAAKTEAVTDDFISFDFGDPEEESDEYEPAPATISESTKANGNGSAASVGLRESAIPTGPRSNLDHGSARQVVSFGLTPTNAKTAQQQGNLARPHDKLGSVGGRMPMTIDLTDDSSSSVRNSIPGKSLSAIDTTTDPSLGSRKRNARDEIKPAPKIHDNLKGKKGVPSGAIVPQWQQSPDSPATPWIEMDHSDSVRMGFWLHKEIVDFYDFVKPRPFEQVIREKLIEDLNARVKHQFRDAEVFSFGSFPAGLYLPTADMDLVLISKSFKERGAPVYGSRSFLGKFKTFLLNSKLTTRDGVEVIAGAKVPLVKYVDKLTGLKVDISFENDTGLIANKTFQDWKAQYPAMPMLVTVIKHLLAMRGLNEPVNGGIGGFSVICLVVSLLQHMPQVQSQSMIPEHHLGEILMEFFNLYGNEFNTVTTGIQLKPPAYFSKAHANIPYNKGQPEKLMIIDPNRSDNDISGGAKNTKAILKCFSESYQKLQETMGALQYSSNRRNQSILGCILGGNYTSFKLQREHLLHVHEKLLGPVSAI